MTAAAVAVTLALGCAAEIWNGAVVEEAVRRDVLSRAEALAAAIDPRVVQARPSADYIRRLQDHFLALSQLDSKGVRLGIRFPDGAGFTVLAAPFPPVSNELSDEQRGGFAAAAETGRSRVVGPYPAAGGSLVSAFVPVRNARTGETLLIVLAEADAERWRSELRQGRPDLLPLAVLAAAMLALTGLVLHYRDRTTPAIQYQLRHVEAAAVALLGLTGTVMISFVIHDHEERAQEAVFAQLGRERVTAIREAFREIQDFHLGATERLFDSSEDVSREEFRAFVEPMLRGGLVEAMSWAPAVPIPARPDFEARIRAQGVPFAIHPEPGTGSAVDTLYPVVYREPHAENDAILGFDLGSEAVRRAAMLEAATSRMPVVSEPIHLLEKKSSQIGMLCFQPVFARPPGEARAGPPALQGFVVALLRVRPLIDRALAFRAGEPEAVLSELYQLRPDGPPALLAAADPGDIDPVPLTASGTRPATVFPVFFLGKTYGVALRPGPGFDAGYPQRAGWGGALAGLLATAAAAGLTGLTISRRRGLEQGVRERTWRLDSILRGTRAGTWEWTLQSGALEINDRWAEIVGYTREELEPISLETWKALCHPDDLGHSNELMFAHLRGEVGYYDCECRMRHKSGHWVWVQDRGAVARRGPDGEPLTISGTHIDITEHKLAEEAFQRSEEKLRLAMEATSDGMWDRDIRRGLVEWSDRCYTMLGYAPQEFPLSHEVWQSLIHPDDRQAAVAENERCIREGSPLAIEFRYRCKDGSWLWVLGRGRVVSREGNVPLRMVGTHTDIDRRRRAEDEAIRARRDAELASRAKSEFLANTSHELRTPLNSIIGFSSALVSGAFGTISNPKHREYLADIESSGQHLLALISDILDLSAVEAGKLELREEEVDVAAACAAVVRIVKIRADKGLLGLTVTVPRDLPRLRADERRVKQVLLNLLTNAIKFTPANGRVELSVRIEPGGGLSFVVDDTGIGMDEDGMQRAMMEFVQVESSFSRKYEGAGLGLPLSRRLMERHGGTLRLSSELGVGTVAIATFPADRVIVAQAAVAD